jgi:hypothetical protein
VERTFGASLDSFVTEAGRTGAVNTRTALRLVTAMQ